MKSKREQHSPFDDIPLEILGKEKEMAQTINIFIAQHLSLVEILRIKCYSPVS
jgi:hypothetical protein